MGQVWQYRLVSFATGRETSSVERDLNAYGRAGWEVVGVAGVGAFGSQTTFVLKRALDGEPDPNAEPGVEQVKGWI